MSKISEEYKKRRRNLMRQMGEGSIAIIPGTHEVVRSRDTHYPFRQDSNLAYLTGFPEPEALVVLIPGRSQAEFIVFCRDKDRSREIWDGFRAGPDGAQSEYGADDAFPISDMDDILPGLIEGREKVYCSMGSHPDFDTKLLNWINHIRAQSRAGVSPPGEIIDLEHMIHEMRVIKTAAELGLMRKAGKISAGAHKIAMKACKPGMYEYQLQALIEHEFADNGADAPAYSSIVGSGDNACILHYIENRAVMKDGDLVLIDAGCEYQGYAADLTRTFPVNGKFTDEQRAIYEIVIEAQAVAIDACRIGNAYNKPHDDSLKVIVEGLRELKLLKGTTEEIIENCSYKDFYMHRVGHWLGMDVHDAGDYKVDGADSSWREFESGMVTTVEPGIYIHADNKKIPAKWRGIGIRIEDDIAVRKSGPEIMTTAVPNQISEIEQLMRG